MSDGPPQIPQQDPSTPFLFHESNYDVEHLSENQHLSDESQTHGSIVGHYGNTIAYDDFPYTDLEEPELPTEDTETPIDVTTSHDGESDDLGDAPTYDSDTAVDTPEENYVTDISTEPAGDGPCPPNWETVMKPGDKWPGGSVEIMYEDKDSQCAQYEYIVYNTDKSGNPMDPIRATSVKVTSSGATLYKPFTFDGGKARPVGGQGESMGIPKWPSDKGIYICRRCVKKQVVDEAFDYSLQQTGQKRFENPEDEKYPEKHGCRGANDEWRQRVDELAEALRNELEKSNSTLDKAIYGTVGEALSMQGVKMLITATVEDMAEKTVGRVPVGKVIKFAVKEALKRSSLGKGDRTWKDTAKDLAKELVKEVTKDLGPLGEKLKDQIEEKVDKKLDEIIKEGKLTEYAAQFKMAEYRAKMWPGAAGLGYIKNLSANIVRQIKVDRAGSAYCCYTVYINCEFYQGRNDKAEPKFNVQIVMSWCYLDGYGDEKLKEGQVKTIMKMTDLDK